MNYETVRIYKAAQLGSRHLPILSEIAWNSQDIKAKNFKIMQM